MLPYLGGGVGGGGTDGGDGMNYSEGTGGASRPESVWGIVGSGEHPGLVRRTTVVGGGGEEELEVHSTVQELPPHKHSGTVIMSRSHRPGQAPGQVGPSNNLETTTTKEKETWTKKTKKEKKMKKRPPLHFDATQVFGRRHTAVHAAGAGFKAVQVLTGRAEAYVLQ